MQCTTQTQTLQRFVTKPYSAKVPVSWHSFGQRHAILRHCRAYRVSQWKGIVSICTAYMPHSYVERWGGCADECHEIVIRQASAWCGINRHLDLSLISWMDKSWLTSCVPGLFGVTAAGIYALRRLKVKRCGELAQRLSSRLTFACVYVVVRAIHSSRCISAGPLVYFIQARNFSVVVRANLTVNMPYGYL